MIRGDVMQGGMLSLAGATAIEAIEANVETGRVILNA